MAVMNLSNHGITEDRLIQLNNFVENNLHETSNYAIRSENMLPELAIGLNKETASKMLRYSNLMT
jgi:hypothetical protein